MNIWYKNNLNKFSSIKLSFLILQGFQWFATYLAPNEEMMTYSQLDPLEQIWFNKKIFQ